MADQGVTGFVVELLLGSRDLQVLLEGLSPQLAGPIVEEYEFDVPVGRNDRLPHVWADSSTAL